MIEIKSYSISPAKLAAILGTGETHQLLDVRTTPEYASAHVPGARLIPLHELNVEAYLSQHTPGTPIYVICQAGARASNANEQVDRAVSNDCVLVEGGTQAWIDVVLTVHRGAGIVLPH